MEKVWIAWKLNVVSRKVATVPVGTGMATTLLSLSPHALIPSAVTNPMSGRYPRARRHVCGVTVMHPPFCCSVVNSAYDMRGAVAAVPRVSVARIESYWTLCERLRGERGVRSFDQRPMTAITRDA